MFAEVGIKMLPNFFALLSIFFMIFICAIMILVPEGEELAWASDHDLNTNPMNYYNIISIQI